MSLPDHDETKQDASWHLDKRVPLSFVAFLVLQAVALIVFAVEIRGRVHNLEQQRHEHDTSDLAIHIEQNRRLLALEGFTPKIAVIEARQLDVIKRLDDLAEKADRIESKLDRMNPPIIPRGNNLERR